MLSKWKVTVITGLFVLGALSFFLGLFPTFAAVFWVLWFAGCGACILALALTVLVPADRPTANSPTATRAEANRRSPVNRGSEANRRAANGLAAAPAAESADGVSQP